MHSQGTKEVPPTPRRGNAKSKARLVARLAVFLAVLAAGLSAGLFGILQTSWAKEALTRWAVARLAASGLSVDATPVEGLIPWRVRIPHIEVADAKGICLRADGIDVSWDPLGALRGRIHVREAVAESVYVARLPELKEPRRPLDLASVLQLLSNLRADRIHVSRMTVANERTLANADVELDGTLASAADAGAIQSSLHIRPLAGPATSASVEVSVKTDLSSMSVQANYTEAPGGFLAAVLHLPDALPVEIALNGDGPLSDWRGVVKASWGEATALDSPLHIRWSGALDVSMDGTFRLADAIVPAAVRPWLDDANKVRLAVSADSFDKLTLRDVNLSSSKADVQTRGFINVKTGALSADYTATVKDAALVEQMSGVSLEAPVEIKGTFDGPFRNPQVVADADFRAFAYAGFKADAMQCHFDARVDEERRIEIAEAKITIGEQRFSASGEIRAAERKGTLEFEIAAKELVGWLKRSGFHRFADFGLDGSIAAKGKTTFDIALRFATANIEGTLTDLRGLPKAIESFASDPVRFGTTFSTKDGKRICLENVKAETPRFSAEGEGLFRPDNQEVDASYRISAPETEFLAPFVGRSVSGSLALKGEASGVWPALKTELTVEAKNAAVGSLRTDRVKLSAEAERFPEELKGRVKALVVKAGQEGTLASEAALRKGSLELGALKISMPGGSVKGKIAADLGKRRCKGDLHASLTDLAWLGQTAGRELAGKAVADLKLDADKANQRLTGDVKATGLRTGASSVESATAKFDLRNLLDAPYGSLHVELAQGALGKLAVRKASVDYNGDPRRGEASIRLDGAYGQPMDLSLKAKVVRSGDGIEFDVTELAGHGYKRSVALSQPFVVTVDHAGLSTGKAMLALAPSGRVEAAFRMNRDDVHAEIGLSDLSLDKMPKGDKPVVSGAVSGQIVLNGDPARPSGAAQIRIVNLRPALPSMAQFVPASVAIDAKVDGGVLHADLSEKGELLGNPVEGGFSVPVQMSVLPPAFKIPDDGALDGKLAIHADLARVASLLLLDDQRMSGTADLELTMGGTAAQPVFKGAGAVQNGSYEHFASGTVLKEIRAKLSGDGARLRLDEATATDGGGGHIEASGSMLLSLAKGLPLDVDVGIKGCTLIRRDDITASFDAGMKLAGTVVVPKITGSVHAETIEINIPDRAPPPVVALDVHDQGVPAAKAETDAAPRFRRGWLRAHFGLDFDLDAPGRMFVRGQGIDSEWKGKFHFTGTALEPSITGDATLVRGRYSILGKRFAFTKGTAQFRGEWPVAPAIDVESETQLKDMKGYLKVTGTSAAPTLTIESDPPAARDEILARMLFNRDLARISPFEALQLAEAADMLAGGKGMLQFTERARKILRVDNIDVAQDRDDVKDSSVRVGKYLRDDVYVQVEQGLNSDSGKLQTEVNITPDLSVESTVDRNAKTGIGLKWKKDY